MNLGLDGAVAIVTGGSGGIGLATCLALAEEGAHVVIADISDGSTDDTRPAADRVSELGPRAVHVATDITSRQAVEHLRDQVLDDFGRIDVLVNNAAWWPTPTGFFWDEDPTHWGRMLDVTLGGTLNCCHVIGEHLRQQGSGTIVNISSDSARLGEQRETTYSAAKGGIISLTMSLAIGYGPSGVRVNCVSPGRTVTPTYAEHKQGALDAGEDAAARFLDREKRALRYYPLRKFGEPSDVARMVVAMASPVLCSHVTGQVVSVSGGYFVG